jgi:hypothetical protein
MDPIIKTFVDNGIEWLKQKDHLRRPDPNMPSDMLDENGTHSNDWKPWKAIPSTVKDSELEEIEAKIGFKLPNSYKQFLKYKHCYTIHTSGDYEPFNHLSSNWKEELYERYFNSDLKPFMLDSGFIWFGDFQDWGFLCFDTNKKTNEEHEYPVVLIDHETVDQQELMYKDFKDCLVKNTISL